MSAKAKSVPPTCHSSNNMHSEDATQRRAILTGQGSLVLDGVEIQEFSTSPTSPNLKLDRVEVDGRQSHHLLKRMQSEKCKVSTSVHSLLCLESKAPKGGSQFHRDFWTPAVAITGVLVAEIGIYSGTSAKSPCFSIFDIFYTFNSINTNLNITECYGSKWGTRTCTTNFSNVENPWRKKGFDLFSDHLLNQSLGGMADHLLSQLNLRGIFRALTLVLFDVVSPRRAIHLPKQKRFMNVGACTGLFWHRFIMFHHPFWGIPTF